jgi:PQQ-dependent dehydrogenase (methanol/ethanol family)
MHDYDGTNENVLIELPAAGSVQSVLVHPDRNGYMYVIDRATGRIVSAEPYAHINTSTGVDRANGRLLYAPDKEPKSGKVVRNICPASPGAKDWQPSAYSPRTRWLYVPMQNLCQDMEAMQVSYIAGTPYVGSDQKMYAGPGGKRGELAAWDPLGRRKVWSVDEKYPVWSGALATAGDVIFYGTLEGWFKAVDATTGAILWKFKTGSGIVGQPISYLGPDGRQYVAVLSGVGGWAGTVVTGNLDTRDATAAMGFANAMVDLPAQTRMGGMLYVFALPQ